MRPFHLLLLAAALGTLGGSAGAQSPPAATAPRAPPPGTQSPADPPLGSAPPPGSPPPGSPPPGSPPPGSPPPGSPPPPPGYAPPGYPPPGYYPPAYYPPPPAAGPPADARTHSGFFLRMGLGGGYMADSATVRAGSLTGGVDARGGAFTLEVDIGGAINPGFILAGSFIVHAMNDATLRNDTRAYRPQHDTSLTLLAAMVDVYPNPRAGFHVGGALGLASMRVRPEQDQYASDDGQSGWGLAPHVGYEWWVGHYWGIGGLARFLYARAKGDYATGSVTDSVAAATLLFTATYN